MLLESGVLKIGILSVHNQQQKALFYGFVYQTYRSPLMKLLVDVHLKGLTLKERNFINIVINRKEKERGCQTLLLTYLIIHRNEKDGYITNLIKELFEDIDIDEFVDDFECHHFELNDLITYLELPKLDNTKYVEKNLHYFQFKV